MARDEDHRDLGDYWVTARKERCESLTVNQMLLFDSEEPEKTKEILV